MAAVNAKVLSFSFFKLDVFFVGRFSNYIFMYIIYVIMNENIISETLIRYIFYSVIHYEITFNRVIIVQLFVIIIEKSRTNCASQTFSML